VPLKIFTEIYLLQTSFGNSAVYGTRATNVWDDKR